jgi:hypothetical protein
MRALALVDFFPVGAQRKKDPLLLRVLSPLSDRADANPPFESAPNKTSVTTLKGVELAVELPRLVAVADVAQCPSVSAPRPCAQCNADDGTLLQFDDVYLQRSASHFGLGNGEVK